LAIKIGYFLAAVANIPKFDGLIALSGLDKSMMAMAFAINKERTN
jgi:hypothetical protein